jgi:hypothetical protein
MSVLAAESDDAGPAATGSKRVSTRSGPSNVYTWQPRTVAAKNMSILRMAFLRTFWLDSVGFIGRADVAGLIELAGYQRKGMPTD